MARKQKELGLQNWLDIFTTNCFQYQAEGGDVEAKESDGKAIIVFNGATFKGGRFMLIAPDDTLKKT